YIVPYMRKRKYKKMNTFPLKITTFAAQNEATNYIIISRYFLVGQSYLFPFSGKDQLVIINII
ncbi:MAG: hypothetical protein LIP05_00845, partial [Tannerellaceae bacterium]|nr:hypothetical protein [Tannerellaceae bacterium]